MNFTIVEPGFEFIPPSDDYLKFLEVCTRTCYKSESRICEGSAEKLMHKVVNEYEHLSVTEHSNCVIKAPINIYDDYGKTYLNNKFIDISKGKDSIIISGNLRVWKEILDKTKTTFGGYPLGCIIYGLKLGIVQRVKDKWPFFFDYPDIKAFSSRDYDSAIDSVILLDDNPITNRDNLTKAELLKHTTLTYKIICSRSCSHQLVRHRMMSFSQESQRYVNYGKKGMQVILPTSIAAMPTAFSNWENSISRAYDDYMELLSSGLPPEDARSVLPNSSKTEIITTGTLAQWKHIFDHRANNPKAQEEIRTIMQGIQEHAKSILPGVFD